ncbi:hypothetical protein EDC04DRAFT_2673611 [Pisolithus marmoratus]|nr:hypothetical protein EDC04DRAFT_2673611 [Pisolithus marmoratus]
MSTPPSSTIHQNVVPSEVGWQFVPQYYTYVNKHPNRLHCFYTKTSTFTHGMEGEDVKPCFGQQEIHNKITSLGFQDCKVYIHSVDAQSSANGGIIIQVIGEMSNHGDPWKKFVQTFFLAEQPNGYFVLNDIFRFLKEESTEDDASETDAATLVEQPSSSPEQPAAEPAPVPAPRARARASPGPSAHCGTCLFSAFPSPEELTTVNPQPPTPPPAAETKLPEPNGIHPTESETQPPFPPEPAPAPAPVSPPQASPTPVTQSPKSWASLAATDSKRWGAAVAQESKGLSEVPASSSSPVPATHSPAPHGHRGQHHGPREYPAVAAAQALTTPQCFVKGVVEPVTSNQLMQTLGQRFGPVKDVEVVRQKACAFLNYAIIASLPQNQGGEGGIRIDLGGDAGMVRIVVETRKERGDRPQSRPRGSGPMNGDSRGGFRGGRGGVGYPRFIY